MQETAKAVYQFFSGFNIPAYDQQAVPEDAEPPYITYYIQEPEWGRQSTGYAQVWYRTKSRATVNAKTDEIASAIGDRGVNLECRGGYVMIRPESPLIVPVKDGDVIGNRINFILNAYHMPGT